MQIFFGLSARSLVEYDMTVLDAGLKLYTWFQENESVVLDRDFQKIVLISTNEEEDYACFTAALKDLEGQGMVSRETHKDTEYWILKQPFSSFEQSVKINSHLAKQIAEEINNFCDQIQDHTDRCDVSALTERDIGNIVFMYQTAKNSLYGKNLLEGGLTGDNVDGSIS